MPDERLKNGGTESQMVRSSKELALKTLRNVCNNLKAPASARAQAARTLLEYLGEVGRLQSAKRDSVSAPVSELSDADLDAEITRLAALARQSGTAAKPAKRKNVYRLL